MHGRYYKYKRVSQLRLVSKARPGEVVRLRDATAYPRSAGFLSTARTPGDDADFAGEGSRHSTQPRLTRLPSDGKAVPVTEATTTFPLAQHPATVEPPRGL